MTVHRAADLTALAFLALYGIAFSAAYPGLVLALLVALVAVLAARLALGYGLLLWARIRADWRTRRRLREAGR